ncbi:uncharacterized protein LOC111400666 [Olea europaea var. sylvestris]|uniref:uncharacterized protein LOC111400666 n=1 Tax=Olea europaea var. sylvestris TaxID=158386 RepID=UPI000C1D8850|nr:uncharacterized protein LOC111400666 [Olea europaea var. sylvestris]
MKEQMSIVLRYVDNSGHVNERFIGIEHVISTTALSLKAAIDKVFSRYNLSMSRLRGQGHDGASNMQGKFNGLKTLILNESPCAFYIHCFPHQLQLALVAVVKKNIPITNFFGVVGNVINTIGASSKRCLLREKQLDFIFEALEKCEILSGRGLNQETTLQRSGDTRWSSHYNSLVSLLAMFSSVLDVLVIIIEDESCSCDQRSDATNLLELIQRFDFAFNLQLMRSVLGISNELSKALQRKDQDIVNAMQLVRLCKRRLQIMRDEGWDSFLEEVCSFCQKHYIHVPNMDDIFVRLAIRGRPQCNSPEITNLHHYRVDLFYSVIDLQFQELNDRFSDVNTELLLCVACLCPQDSFSSFDKKNLIRLAELYPLDFSAVDGIVLSDQLETYIFDMRFNKEFEGLNGLGDLAEKLVLTKKDKVYPLVYRLLTLALILPVATTTVERVFSAMSIVKNILFNRMDDRWMNDSTIVYDDDCTSSQVHRAELKEVVLPYVITILCRDHTHYPPDDLDFNGGSHLVGDHYEPYTSATSNPSKAIVFESNNPVSTGELQNIQVAYRLNGKNYLKWLLHQDITTKLENKQEKYYKKNGRRTNPQPFTETRTKRHLDEGPFIYGAQTQENTGLYPSV